MNPKGRNTQTGPSLVENRYSPIHDFFYDIRSTLPLVGSSQGFVRSLTNFLYLITIGIFVATCVFYSLPAQLLNEESVVTSEWEKTGLAPPARIKTPKEYVSRLPVILNSLISPSVPFVFLHLRKSGGSRIRELLHASAYELGLSSYIPCFGGISCNTYTVPSDLKNASVLAGHFYFDSVQLYGLQNEAKLHGSGILPKPKPPYCLVQVREPVSRVTSCWNYRLISSGSPHGTEVQRIEDLSPEDVAMMLPIAHSYYGIGCNNEMFRIISPLGMAERIVNSIDEHLGARFALDSLMDRLGGCVVTISDRCDESTKIVNHFIPWMRWENCSKTVNKGLEPKQLRNETKKVITEANTMELAAYEFAVQLFEQQLDTARAASFV